MSVKYVPAIDAVVEVVVPAVPEKYILELTPVQFLFVLHCAGQLCDRHKLADPIGYKDYSRYKEKIGFKGTDVDEKPFQFVAEQTIKFFEDKTQ